MEVTVKKPIALTAGAVGATALSMAMFGTGVAAADDYAGQTYADASSALSGASLKGASPFWRAEWWALGEGTDRARYWPLSHIEQWIPILFGLAYISGFLVIVLA
jgi:hypothetical protein